MHALYNPFSLLSLTIIILFSVVCTAPAAVGTDESKGLVNTTDTFKYHNGPVLSSNISVYLIWYGTWPATHKQIIRDFIESFNDPNVRSPSVADWWRAITLYKDLSGANVSRSVALGGETIDNGSQGQSLTRLSIQSVITTAITAENNTIRVDPRGGVYIVLTSEDIYVEKFCQICGFHLFTFPSIAGFTLPFIWVGNSAKMCPGTCAWPYVVPKYMPGMEPLKPPNGVAEVDGMIDIIGHELAEIATNPLTNGWYVGDPMFPWEVADACQGVYGVGGGSGYVGNVSYDSKGAVYNMYGTRRKFMVQWVWSHVANTCVGNM